MLLVLEPVALSRILCNSSVTFCRRIQTRQTCDSSMDTLPDLQPVATSTPKHEDRFTYRAFHRSQPSTSQTSDEKQVQLTAIITYPFIKSSHIIRNQYNSVIIATNRLSMSPLYDSEYVMKMLTSPPHTVTQNNLAAYLGQLLQHT